MSASNIVRRLVFQRGLTIATVLAVVGIAAMAGAAWVVANPPMETVTEQTDVQMVSVDTRTSALVTGNSTLYEPGERLEDMPVYFLRASPHLTITTVTMTPAGVQTQVSQELTLEQVATRDGQPFYSANRTLIEQTDGASNGRVEASAQLNMSEVRSQVNRAQEEIGAVGVYQTRLELTVRYQTDQYDGTLEATTPLIFTSGAYWLSGSLSASRQHSTPVTREVSQPADPVVYGGLTVIGLLSLGGAGAVVYLRRRMDVEDLQAEFYHDEYEEWISAGEFPTSTDKRYISINSLEDLVDIAIDSQKRVIFDPSLEVYSVVDGDLIYYFSRDPFNIDVWLDT